MTFAQKKLPKSQVEITVEVPAEEFDSWDEKAIASLGENLRVEGFRPGHVPAELVTREVGEEKVLAKAAELAVRKNYLKILQEERIDVIGEPEIQILKLAPGNPLVFKVTIAVVPEVELPDYKRLASEAERKAVVVEDKEIQEALRWLRESRKQEDGTIPEASDDFARSLGHFANVSALQGSLKEGLQYEKEARETERLRQEILEKIAEHSRVEVSDVLVAREKAAMMENVKKGVLETLQMEFSEYLRKLGKSEEELFASFEPEAERRVKKFLVLREISRQEGITATPEEVQEETNRIIQHYKDVKAAARDIDPNRLKEYTEGVIRHEKTLAFLEGFVSLRDISRRETN